MAHLPAKHEKTARSVPRDALSRSHDGIPILSDLRAREPSGETLSFGIHPGVWEDSEKIFGRSEDLLGAGGTGPYGSSWQLRRGGLPWLAAWQREKDVGHWSRSAPTKSKCHLERLPAVCLAGSGPPRLAVRHREADVGHLGPPERQAVGSSGSTADFRHVVSACPPIRVLDGRRAVEPLPIFDWRWGRGAPPWLAVKHREVDVGRGSGGPNALVGRTYSPTTAVDPAWLAVRHREVDVGDGPRGAQPTWRGCLPTRTTAVNCRNGRSGGPKVWKDSDRTFGRCEGVDPPIGYDRAREWICHVRGDCWSRSDCIGRDHLKNTHARLPHWIQEGGQAKARRRKGQNLLYMFGDFAAWREDVFSFACAFEISSRLRSRLRNIASTTRSCSSDAEHEFSRTRSPGRYPMLLFRDTGGPQLLLMRTSSIGKGVESNSELDSTGEAIHEAFS